MVPLFHIVYSVGEDKDVCHGLMVLKQNLWLLLKYELANNAWNELGILDTVGSTVWYIKGSGEVLHIPSHDATALDIWM